MQQSANLYLIGPMGVGKSTIGRMLASALDRPFFDSDREIEAATGADIPWIFDVEGEAGFRVREERMINTLTQREGIVLATGGGAILSENSRTNLNRRGTVVYLKASLAQQFERTSKDRNRPLLQTADPMSRIRELMKIRDPLYTETAHITVDTSRRGPRTVVTEILRRLREYETPTVPDA
ncbi:MAG: shikimate kinase AroK [Pseudohongiella sp.]|uniref:shikimate kinase AroK n=1 Tax=Pseudohongiella sp. TaxID=1979412 RepID=UPI0034A00FE0